MGYPTDFKIPVSDTQAYKQFGNSVVVPVVERIAKAVVSTLQRPVDYRPNLFLAMTRNNKKKSDPVPLAKPVSYLKRSRKKSVALKK